MATQKPSSGNRAQWVTAFSMAIIAICLVLIVIHEYSNRPKDEAVTITEPSKPIAAPAQAKNIPAIARPKSSHPASKEPDAIATSARDQVVENSSSPASVALAVPMVTGEKFVSTGLAPLTFLATTNSGVITGRVVLKGTPLSESIIQQDAVCGKLRLTPIKTRRYVVSKDGGLANVFVYISTDMGYDYSRPKPAVLNQVGCEFQPYVLGLTARQDLIITNSDSSLHNVHVEAQPPLNPSFNVPELPRAAIAKSFSTREIPIVVRCDVHPWMYAYLCVVEHPFFAVTDSNGYYTITNVPPGKYELTAFHVHNSREHRKPITDNVSVKEHETATANFVIDAPSTSLAHK